jgi:hypothetical protein
MCHRPSMSHARSLSLLIVAFLFATTACQQRMNNRIDALKIKEQYEKRQRYNDAIQAGEKWLKRDPNDAYIRTLIAAAFLKKAETEKDNRVDSIGRAGGPHLLPLQMWGGSNN